MIRRKEEDMNWKRFWIASLVIFVVIQAMEFVINNYLMMSAFEAAKSLWRPDMMDKMWIMYVLSLLSAVLFTYIFVKGREGKGILEGVRFGILMALYISLPMSHGLYVLIPIPYSFALQWLIYGALEMLVAGILVAAIYRPKTAKV
jgi:hypothetical protein